MAKQPEAGGLFHPHSCLARELSATKPSPGFCDSASVANRNSQFFLKSTEELHSERIERDDIRDHREKNPNLPRRGAIFKLKREILFLSGNLLSLYYLLLEIFYVECISTNSVPRSRTFIFREKSSFNVSISLYCQSYATSLRKSNTLCSH